MYNKIHKHLTFLFTGIASLILIVMSVICLHMSEQALEKNSFLSFSGKMNTLVSNFEQQTNISQEWLAKVSENGTYQIAVYDNGVPLSYTSITLSGDTLALMAEIMEQQDDMIHDITYENPYSSPHREFSYTSKGGADYYACLVRIRRSAGDLTAVILYSTEALSRQLMTTRIRFLCINLIGILLLSVFSWYYTKRLLLPEVTGTAGGFYLCGLPRAADAARRYHIVPLRYPVQPEYGALFDGALCNGTLSNGARFDGHFSGKNYSVGKYDDREFPVGKTKPLPPYDRDREPPDVTPCHGSSDAGALRPSHMVFSYERSGS